MLEDRCRLCRSDSGSRITDDSVFIMIENYGSLDQAMALTVIFPTTALLMWRKFRRSWRLLLLFFKPSGRSMFFLTLRARKVLCKVLASHCTIHWALWRLDLFTRALVFEKNPLADG